MISEDEARERIAGRVAPLGSEKVAPRFAAGRVLAEDVAAVDDLPRFDNSAMDGYAVRSADTASASPERPVELVLTGTAAAGGPAPRAVGPGEAARILTGAALPEGADCVVMQEAVVCPKGLSFGCEKGRVRLARPARPGQHVRPRGEDVKAGTALLKSGAELRPYEIALLASQGIERVAVVRRPRVAVLATGDELAVPGRPLGPGQIRNSNGPALCAALARWGIDPVDAGTAGDSVEALAEALEPHAKAADVLLVSGGVSVGDRDFTREALASLGFEEVFWRVAIKPGKPLFFAVRGATLAFGLPGNPVASLVCLEEFVRPALEGLQGRSLRYPSYHLAGRAANEYPAAEGRRQYLFCEAEREGGGYRLKIIRPQGSAMLGMACRANALARTAAGEAVKAGDALEFRWLK